MPRIRANVTIEPELHEAAKTHARAAHGTDFSGLVTKLLIADLGQAYVQMRISQPIQKVLNLQQNMTEKEAVRLAHGPRALRSKEVPPEKSRSKKAAIVAAKKAALAAREEVDAAHHKASVGHRSRVSKTGISNPR